MKIIDLSSPVNTSFHEPDDVVHEVLSPRAGAEHMAAEMMTHFGLEFDPDTLPDGEFLSLDRLSLTTHTGTHVDAPSHYGSRASYRNSGPRHIDELPLEWFYGPGIVLDISDTDGRLARSDDLRRAWERRGRKPVSGDIVLLRTGADELIGKREYFTNFIGLDGTAVHLLLDLGVRVIGTDAFSLDAPFPEIIRHFRETGDRDTLWPAHVIGRDREYCQIERLAHLDALPARRFTVACFPIKITGAGAGWARAVALLDDAKS